MRSPFLFFFKLKEKNYEEIVLFLLALLGVSRMVIALLLDVIRTRPVAAEIATDTILLGVFIWLLKVANKVKSQQEISIVFGVIASLLILVNYLEFGGAMGNARFNFYAGIFLIVMLYSGKRMNWLLILYFSLMMFINYGFIMEKEWMAQFKIEAGYNLANFIFTLICITLLTVFLKYITEAQIDRYESLNIELRTKIRESKQANRKLGKQHQELAKAQAILEQEVKLKTEALEAKNRAIENYIKYNTNYLQSPLVTLDQLVTEIKGNETMPVLLRASCAELKTVIENIKITFDSEEHLDRTKV